MVFQPTHLTTLGIGIGTAIAIFTLVRKNHLMVSHAIWWLMVAAVSMAFGIYPRLIDKIGAVFGIHYPPTLLIVVGMGSILIKMLTMDLKLSKQERNIRALTQRLAILESEMYSKDPSHRVSALEPFCDTKDASVHEAEITVREEGMQAENSREI